MDSKQAKDTFRFLLSDRIWTFDAGGLSGVRRRLFRLVKLIRILIDDFQVKRMGFQCVALSYFCTMAAIPLLAFIFFVTSGLGLSDRISTVLYNALPNNQDLVSTLLLKANGVLEVAQSGVVGWLSAATLLWAILWMMFQVERVFNNVWGIQKIPRKIYRRFSIYILTLVLIPLIVVIFCAGIALYSNFFTLIGMERFSEIRILYKLLGWLVFYAVTVFTLSAMYKFIPAAHVHYRYALLAALIAGAGFDIFQFFYLQTQMFVTRLNTVYGAIAAVPLFLMWLNFSWQFVIYGATLSFGLQNIDTYNISNELTFRDAFGADKESRKRRREARRR